MCLSICLYLSVSVSVCVTYCLCEMCMCVVCVCVCVCVCVSVCVVRVYVYVHTCVCVCVQGALQHFGLLCDAFTSWRRFADNGLHNEMAQVMQLYKQSLAAASQWDAATGSLPQPVRERLQQHFAV